MNIALTQETNCTFTPVWLPVHWELGWCVALSLLSLLAQMHTDPYCCINRRDCADPIKSKRSLEWVCLFFTALRYSLETCLSRRLKSTEYLCNCGMFSVFLISPKEQMDPFRLPAEVSEWVILLLSRKSSHR